MEKTDASAIQKGHDEIPFLTEAAVGVLLAGAPREPPRLSGTLLKQASNWLSGFQSRHFEVGEGRVRYWTNVDEMMCRKKPHAEYSLLGLKMEVDEASDAKFRAVFAGQHRSPYVLSVDASHESGEEMHSREDWLQAFLENANFARRMAAYDRASKMVIIDESFITAHSGESDFVEPCENASDTTDAESKHVEVSSFVSINEYEVTSFDNSSEANIVSGDKPSKALEAAVICLAHGEPVAPPALSGPLLKQAARHSRGFQLRHFVVSEGKVCYWHSKTDMEVNAAPCAEYQLCDILFQEDEDVSTFEVNFPENQARVYTLKADVGDAVPGAHSRSDWLRALDEHAKYAKKKVIYKRAAQIADC